MAYGYLGQNTPNQTVNNSGVFSITDSADLESQGSLGGSLELIEEQTVSAVSHIDFTSIQEDKYDVHYMTVNAFTGSNINIRLRFYENGVLETADVYQQAHQWGASNGTFLEIKDTADGEIEVANTTSDPSSAYIYFYNLGNSSKYSFTTSQSFNDDSDDARAVFMFGGGVLPQASLVNGIRVLPLSGTITSATVKLYGVKQI